MANPLPVLTLLVEKGPRKGQTLQQRAGALLRIGRVVKGNDLAVGDAGVSQRHLDLAFLPPLASRWAATDLGSSNGTLLNGAPLVPTVPAPISHGDRIKIGESTVLAISIAADAGPEPAATRRSTRHAASAAAAAADVEEDKAPAVRRGRRKAPAAKDPPEAVKAEAEVPTRRGGRKKAAAAVVPVEHEKEEAAPAASDPLEAVKAEAEVPTRRGGRKKAAAAVVPLEQEKEEAAPVKRRGERKKAVERPEVEREEDEEVQAGGLSKASVTAALPPQPQTTRATRAAARRADAVETGEDKGEGEQTRRGRGRVTRQSATKAREVVHEEKEEGKVAVPQEETTANPSREKDDNVENVDGTSKATEVEVPVTLKEPAEKTRKGRGRVRANTMKAKDPVIEEDARKEVEDGGVVGARECSGNMPQMTATKGSDRKEDEGTTGNGEVEGASKAEVDQVVEEEGDAPLATGGQTQRAPNGAADTDIASSDKDVEGKGSGGEEGSDIDQESMERMVLESKFDDGVGEAGENGKREVTGCRGEQEGGKNVDKCTGRCNLENMTLKEWFVQIEKYILAKNHEAAEKAIAEVKEKHRRFDEYIKTLK